MTANRVIALSPAYGRDYESAVEVEKHWNENRDFKIYPRGPYVNKQQTDGLKEEGFSGVVIKYKRRNDGLFCNEFLIAI